MIKANQSPLNLLQKILQGLHKILESLLRILHKNHLSKHYQSHQLHLRASHRSLPVMSPNLSLNMDRILSLLSSKSPLSLIHACHISPSLTSGCNVNRSKSKRTRHRPKKILRLQNHRNRHPSHPSHNLSLKRIHPSHPSRHPSLLKIHQSLPRAHLNLLNHLLRIPLNLLLTLLSLHSHLKISLLRLQRNLSYQRAKNVTLIKHQTRPYT